MCVTSDPHNIVYHFRPFDHPICDLIFLETVYGEQLGNANDILLGMCCRDASVNIWYKVVQA